MNDCIFCQIVAGKIPCYKVYDDKEFLGFLDISPRTRGHSLLIPKKHYRWVWEVPDFGKYWETALKLTQTMQKALKPYFITYVTHGLEVPHAHIHILPREKQETEFVPEVKTISKEEMQEIAKKIKNQLRR